MPQQPGIGYPSQGQAGLWRDIARNLFEIAQSYGYNDWLEPNALDGEINSMRKAVLYSDYIASHMP